MKISAGRQRLCWGLLLLPCFAHAQEPQVDPNRVFTTPLHWERVAGAPHAEPVRTATGTLVVLYQDGTYAAVTTPLLMSGKEHKIALNLNEGYVVYTGTWSKTDDAMIRIESREVLRHGQPARIVCSGSAPCHAAPDEPLPGPVSARTCRLDKPSDEHLSDTIHCNGGAGLTLTHPAEPIDLANLPEILQSQRAKR